MAAFAPIKETDRLIKKREEKQEYTGKEFPRIVNQPVFYWFNH